MFRSLAAISMFLLGASSFGATIGLDGRGASGSFYDLLTGTDFDELRAFIVGKGHTIQPVLAFDSASLAGLDALIMRQANTTAENFTTAEMQSIHSFVAGGGGLILIGEGGFSSDASVANLNQLTASWGVQFASSPTFGSGYKATSFATHPVTDQIVSIGEDFLRQITSIGAPAVDLTPASAVKIAAALEAANGGGNVVFLTDTSMFTDVTSTADYKLSSLDNKKFLGNAIDWILQNNTQGCPGAGGFVPRLLLSPSTAPVGTQVTLSISQGLGGASAILVFGGDFAAIPMGGGCTLNVAPLFPVTLTLPLGGAGPGTGTLTLPAVVPPGTNGLAVAFQAFIPDPAGAIGFSNSNAVKLIVP